MIRNQHAFTATDLDSIPDQGTKTLQAVQCGQKNTKGLHHCIRGSWLAFIETRHDS